MQKKCLVGRWVGCGIATTYGTWDDGGIGCWLGGIGFRCHQEWGSVC